MKSITYDKITGSGTVDGQTVKTQYENVEFTFPEIADELTPDMSEMSWDELAQWAYCYKRYLQYQSQARSGATLEEATDFVARTPIGRQAQAGVVTQLRKAKKAGKLSPEKEREILALLEDL